jgi:hypothetical protein
MLEDLLGAVRQVHAGRRLRLIRSFEKERTKHRSEDMSIHFHSFIFMFSVDLGGEGTSAFDNISNRGGRD